MRYNPARIKISFDLLFNATIDQNIYTKFKDLYKDCKYFNFCPICTNQLKHEYDYSYCEQHDFKIPDNEIFISFDDYAIDGKNLLNINTNESISLNSIIPDHNNLSLIKIHQALTKYNIFK